MTGWLNWLNVCLYSVLFIAIYLNLFYPFIDALIGEALLQNVLKCKYKITENIQYSTDTEINY